MLLQSFGFFTPHYIYDTSEEYKVAIHNVRDEQKALIKKKSACQRQHRVGSQRQ